MQIPDRRDRAAWSTLDDRKRSPPASPRSRLRHPHRRRGVQRRRRLRQLRGPHRGPGGADRREWEDAQGFKYFEGRWFIRPKETTCGKLDGHDDRELFLTADEFDFETATINGHCTVMPWDEYQRWQRELVEEDRVAAEEEEQDSTFVCRAFYHMGTGEFEPLTGASSLAEAARLGRRHLAAGGGGPIVARAGSAAVGAKRPWRRRR